MRKSEWCLGLTYLAVLAALAAWGPLARRGAEPTCAYDGGPIDPLYRVRIVSHERDHSFCCISCAEAWLRTTTSPPQTVLVTDEASGEPIDAQAAHFVRSVVITHPATGNRIHTFRNPRDAEDHARAFRGTLLDHAERPFGCCTPPPAPSSPR